MSNRYKLGLLGLALAMILALIGIATVTGANATEGDEPCTKTVVIVDQRAWVERIVDEGVSEVIHHEAVTETTPAIWANWAPNDTQGPQDYVPIWPTDERGTWILHDQGVPPGHEGADGVYQQGQGNSPWFYRQAEKVTVITEAFDETVWIKEPSIELVFHPQVSHEETVEVDCPDEPKEPKEPKEPTLTVTQSEKCLAGALVTKTTKPNGNITTSTVNEHPSCAQVDKAGESFQEEGM